MKYSLKQGRTNPGHQVFQATKFCMVAPNRVFLGPQYGIIPCITLLTPRILGWLLGFWKIVGPLV